jgi:Flp pilus assembly pilin Flp
VLTSDQHTGTLGSSPAAVCIAVALIGYVDIKYLSMSLKISINTDFKKMNRELEEIYS